MKSKRYLIPITVFLVIALLVLPVLGCAKKTDNGPTTSLQGQITTLQEQVTTTNSRIGAVENKLATLQTQDPTDVTALESAIAALESELTSLVAELATANIQLTALENQVLVLEAKVATQTMTTPATPTGQVTVVIINPVPPLYVRSDSAGSELNNFTVRITNGTPNYQYVSYSFNFTQTWAKEEITEVTGTELNIWSGYNIDYTAIGTPPAPATNMTLIWIYPSSVNPRVPVAPGAVVEIQYRLKMVTNDNAQWEGNITGIVTSTTW